MKKSSSNKFEPLRTNRWTLMLEGVDAFLVKAVDGLAIESRHDHCPTVMIELYNVAGDDQNVRLKAWLDAPQFRPATLKFLDSVGNDSEVWEFNARPKRMCFNKFDYGDDSPVTTYLELEINDFRIKAFPRVLSTKETTEEVVNYSSTMKERRKAVIAGKALRSA